MTYMGTIKASDSGTLSPEAFASINVTTGAITQVSNSASLDAHNGDTYKAACDFTYNGQNVKTGDLIILRGTETNGVISTSNLTIDIVPSGDEPHVAPSFTGDGNGTYNGSTTPATFTSTILNLVDSKNSNSLIAGVTIPNTEKIEITSSISNNKAATLNIKHRETTRIDTSNVGLSSSNGDDTIIDDGNLDAVSLFVLNSANGIETDDYGHVTGVNGTSIVFKHNRLKSASITYSDTTLANNSPLLSKSQATFAIEDDITSKSATIYLESKTLTIGKNDSSNPTAMAIDIKWGSF